MKSDNKMKIIFFGTPDFAVESLDALVKGGYDVAAVVTMPDKPAGRGKKVRMSPVKAYALDHDLPVLQPEKLRDESFLASLREINADLFIVIAFRMLPEAVWGMPRLGTFNLHASLLPKYRGAAPINHAIMNGESKTGVTTFFLTHTIDTGDMISRREIEIGEDENAGQLHDRLMAIGAEEVIKTVKAISDGTLLTTPQPEGDFTPAPKIFKDTCKIDWNIDARRLHNFVRGLAPYPAAWSHLKEINGKPSDVKILATSLKNIPSDLILNPGEARNVGKRLFAGTGTTPIEILEIQPAGKKAMQASAYILGYHPANFL
ncbi:MAG: methionyl-tRNA formyltransferase [Muribaculaceae bacterium]|nr:methionyl-tRNA formyltransferase [Muribaculaceae bacterium]